MKALDRASEAIGTACILASKLGVSKSAISKWKSRNRIPSRRVLPIFKLTGVTPHELRPDLYPNPSDGLMDTK